MLNKKIITVLFLILLVLLFSLIFISVKSCSKEKENAELNLALNTYQLELEIWKEKDGLQRAKIETLQGENAQMLLDIKTKDKALINLQTLVKKYEKKLKSGGSATIISTQTLFDSSFKVKDAPLCHRIDSLSNKWITARYGFMGDTSLFQLVVRDSCSLIIGTEKKKPRRNFVLLTHYNPYTETKSMMTYQVIDTRKQKRLGVGPSITVGLCMPPFKLGVTVGVSLTYNLFYLY